MDRKALIAFVLLGLIMILWGPYLRLISGPPKERTPGEESHSGIDIATAERTVASEPSEDPPSAAVRQTTLTPADTSRRARKIMVDTELYRATLSSEGGTIVSWELKAFEGVGEEWVELIPEDATGALGIALDTEFGDLDLSGYIFACSAEDVTLSEADPVQAITMVLQLEEGRRVEKEFVFRNGTYSFDLKVRLEGFAGIVPTREYDLVWGAGLKSTEADVKEDMSKMAAYALMGDAVAKYDMGGKEEKMDRREDGRSGWIGIRTKYFLLSLIPRSEVAKGIKVRGEKKKIPSGRRSVDMKTFNVALRMPLAVSAPTSHDYEVYLGPQDYAVLQRYGVGLEKCMDMGWAIIRPVSRVILGFFVFVHRFIPNYGLVIIIFSILLKVLFYPLTHKQLEATRKMQELQPQLAALKEKYKKDPQRLNKETMALYKEAGANPLGGCFPLLLQMPVFFALFTVFRSTIELRRAEFVWWIQDLSIKDPYLVLPIVMAATMFIQQKMTMKDPKQAAMVYLMPAIMFFFFMNFASGLVLYWTVFNILSIIQQVFAQRREKVSVRKQ